MEGGLALDPESLQTAQEVCSDSLRTNLSWLFCNSYSEYNPVNACRATPYAVASELRSASVRNLGCFSDAPRSCHFPLPNDPLAIPSPVSATDIPAIRSPARCRRPLYGLGNLSRMSVTPEHVRYSPYLLRSE